MTLGKALIMAGFGIVLASSPAAADPSRKVQMTFDGPVMLPGATLPAGTYFFSRLNPDRTPNFISVATPDMKSRFVFLSQPVPRKAGAGRELKVELSEQGSGLAPALKAYFYPGEEYGIMPVFDKETPKGNSAPANTSIAD